MGMMGMNPMMAMMQGMGGYGGKGGMGGMGTMMTMMGGKGMKGKKEGQEGEEAEAGWVSKKVKKTAFDKPASMSRPESSWSGAGAKKKMKDFPDEQKVFVQNIPDGTTSSGLLEHFKEAGSAVLCDTSKGEIQGTQDATIAFESADDAVMAILQLNGSVVCGNPVIVLPWSDAN